MSDSVDTRVRLAGLLLVACLVAGCAAPAALPEDAEAVELASVPFHPQDRWQCGPAALATILGASGIEIAPRALVPEVWIPGRRGTLAPELAAATRRHGRIAWQITPSLEGLIAELEAGRPVLVFQNLGVEALPRWHYAVVVGIDPDRSEVLLRSGRERLRRTSTALFDRTWARSGRWGLVALRGDERPAGFDRGPWLAAVAAAADAGARETARAAWEHWLEDHPDDAGARFGRAAAAADAGDLPAAAAAYEALLADRGDDVRVLNNLAEVRARQGCHAVAADLIERAAVLATPAEAEVVARTAEDLDARAARGEPPAGRCPLRSW